MVAVENFSLAPLTNSYFENDGATSTSADQVSFSSWSGVAGKKVGKVCLQQMPKAQLSTKRNEACTMFHT